MSTLMPSKLIQEVIQETKKFCIDFNFPKDLQDDPIRSAYKDLWPSGKQVSNLTGKFFNALNKNYSNLHCQIDKQNGVITIDTENLSIKDIGEIKEMLAQFNSDEYSFGTLSCLN